MSVILVIKNYLTKLKYLSILFKMRVCQFFLLANDAFKYDNILSENGDVIDCFIPEILTFKMCSKCVRHDKCPF